MIELLQKTFRSWAAAGLRELRITNSILVCRCLLREGEMSLPHRRYYYPGKFGTFIYLFGERASLNQFLTEHVEQSESGCSRCNDISVAAELVSILPSGLSSRV